MQIGSIDQLFTQGNIETTGANTDLAIQGDSFFVVRKGNQTSTPARQLPARRRRPPRVADERLRGAGQARGGGHFVDGVTDIRLPFGQKAAAKPTDSVKLAGNLDASAPVMLGQIDTTVVPQTDPPTRLDADPLSADDRALAGNERSYIDTSITVYDSVGTKHDLKIVLWKTDQTATGSEWKMQIDDRGLASAGTITGGSGTNEYTLQFDTQG
jgi:flagellar hook protein FlgE